MFHESVLITQNKHQMITIHVRLILLQGSHGARARARLHSDAGTRRRTRSNKNTKINERFRNNQPLRN